MLSIIIVNYRSWSRLSNCLGSIAAQGMDDLEVIVVDNNSDDGKAQQFIIMHPQVKFIVQETNGGFAQACNRGAALAQHPWLLFLNPDTLLPEGTLSALMHRVELEPTWKLVGIRQYNEKGKDTHPHGLFLRWWSVWPVVRSMERMVRGKSASRTWLSTTLVAHPDWISGSFVLMRTPDFQALGGWDERFWMYYEDMDLCKRAADRGWDRIMYNEISCTHSHGGSSRIDPETKAITKTEVILSMIKYLRKYNTPMHFALAMDMFFLTKGIEVLIRYPFSPLVRAMTKRFLQSKIG